MALATLTITAAIAGMTIYQYGSTTSTINVRDIDELDPHVEVRDCPILFPAPGEWKGGASGSPAEETTFGTYNTRMWQAHQSLKYIFIQTQAGAGRDINDYYLAASGNADNIWTALTELNVDGVDVESVNMTPIGVVTDPVGDSHIGCFFDLALRERINA